MKKIPYSKDCKTLTVLVVCGSADCAQVSVRDVSHQDSETYFSLQFCFSVRIRKSRFKKSMYLVFFKALCTTNKIDSV